jgi:hypothetical protein
MDFTDLTDHPRTDNLHRVVNAPEHMALHTKLSSHLLIRCQTGQFAHFPHIMRHGFLEIHMLAQRHCLASWVEMRMIGRVDYHGVNFTTYPVEHFPEIVKLFCFGETVEGIAGSDFIHVAQGDDILSGNRLEIGGALPAEADHGQVQFARSTLGT